jgi:hypothetical protein
LIEDVAAMVGMFVGVEVAGAELEVAGVGVEVTARLVAPPVEVTTVEVTAVEVVGAEDEDTA